MQRGHKVVEKLEQKRPTDAQVNEYLTSKDINKTISTIVNEKNQREGLVHMATLIKALDTKESIPVLLRILLNIESTLKTELNIEKDAVKRRQLEHTLSTVNDAICIFNETLVTLKMGPFDKLAYLTSIATKSQQIVDNLHKLAVDISGISVTADTKENWQSAILWLDGIYRRTADKIEKGPKRCVFVIAGMLPSLEHLDDLGIRKLDAAYVSYGDRLFYVDPELKVFTEVKASVELCQQLYKRAVRELPEKELKKIKELTNHPGTKSADLVVLSALYSEPQTADILNAVHSKQAYVRVGDKVYFVDKSKNVCEELKFLKEDGLEKFDYQMDMGKNQSFRHNLLLDAKQLAAITAETRHKHNDVVVPLRLADGNFKTVDMLEDPPFFKMTGLTKMEISLYYRDAVEQVKKQVLAFDNQKILEQQQAAALRNPKPATGKPVLTQSQSTTFKKVESAPAAVKVTAADAKPAVAPALKKADTTTATTVKAAEQPAVKRANTVPVPAKAKEEAVQAKPALKADESKTSVTVVAVPAPVSVKTVEKEKVVAPQSEPPKAEPVVVPVVETAAVVASEKEKVVVSQPEPVKAEPVVVPTAVLLDVTESEKEKVVVPQSTTVKPEPVVAAPQEEVEKVAVVDQAAPVVVAPAVKVTVTMDKKQKVVELIHAPAKVELQAEVVKSEVVQLAPVKSEPVVEVVKKDEAVVVEQPAPHVVAVSPVQDVAAPEPTKVAEVVMDEELEPVQQDEQVVVLQPVVDVAAEVHAVQPAAEVVDENRSVDSGMRVVKKDGKIYWEIVFENKDRDFLHEVSNVVNDMLANPLADELSKHIKSESLERIRSLRSALQVHHLSESQKAMLSNLRDEGISAAKRYQNTNDSFWHRVYKANSTEATNTIDVLGSTEDTEEHLKELLRLHNSMIGASSVGLFKEITDVLVMALGKLCPQNYVQRLSGKTSTYPEGEESTVLCIEVDDKQKDKLQEIYDVVMGMLTNPLLTLLKKDVNSVDDRMLISSFESAVRRFDLKPEQEQLLSTFRDDAIAAIKNYTTKKDTWRSVFVKKAHHQRAMEVIKALEDAPDNPKMHLLEVFKLYHEMYGDTSVGLFKNLNDLLKITRFSICPRPDVVRQDQYTEANQSSRELASVTLRK